MADITTPEFVEADVPADADETETHVVYTDKEGVSQRIPRSEYHERERNGTL